MFKKILIANRGEIACRIMRTANRMGVDCVAVFSEADRNAMHVRMAQEALCVGSAASTDSYLRVDRVLDAAQKSGAQAIHPGYGFLSENAAFADAVREAGLSFIGPPAQAMRDMGAKDASKRLMEEAEVPLLPGYHGVDQSLETLRLESEKCGLGEGQPVLLKAVLGGGGKGMRIVERREDLEEAIEGARREARASFGDERLLVERYLPRARHIEVQVFCDQLGGAVSLFERDCSVQRRHQKVLEESPAPGVDTALRQQLGEVAVRAARAVAYEGAGTVEFIADAADPRRFYFMEMNTRLQVEHPVTEMVTGLDLVEWQLRVAAGEALPLQQHELAMAGHAFEARIYAEDPEAGFLPGSGSLRHLRPPTEHGDTYAPPELRGSAAGGVVRLDSGVEQGDEVSVFYDPMLAKLIVRGADRPLALRAMQLALAGWESSGLPTNVPFLRRVCESEAFSAGHVHTAFIEEHKAELLPAAPAAPHSSLLFLAALHWLGVRSLALANALPAGSPLASSAFASLGGSVCGGAGASPLELQPLGPGGKAVGEPRRVQVRRLGAAAGRPCAWEMREAGEGEAGEGEWTSVGLGAWEEDTRRFRATVGGRSVQGSALLQPADAPGEEASVTVWARGAVASVAVRDALQQAVRAAAAAAESVGGGTKQGAVLSPMPGKLVKLLVEAGQPVKAGEPLLVLEAMKMEHTLRATADAVVERTFGREGDVVPQRAVLVSFEAASS